MAVNAETPGADAAAGGGAAGGGAAPAGAPSVASTGAELGGMLEYQTGIQKEVLKFNTLSNVENTKHSNKKSMSDKIGQA